MALPTPLRRAPSFGVALFALTLAGVDVADASILVVPSPATPTIASALGVAAVGDTIDVLGHETRTIFPSPDRAESRTI